MAYADTRVTLYNVPLDKENNHTYYFESITKQNYFFSYTATQNGMFIKSYNNLTYIRKDNKIKVPDHIENIRGCNYVRYQNPSYSQKYYYAFVTDMIYKDDGNTELIIETDVFQTWLFDYQINKSFVEREHVNDDTIGKHTTPEGLETGEYICNELVRDENLRDYSYVLLVTEWINGVKPHATSFGGIPSVGGAYVFDNWIDMTSVVIEYSNKGKAEAIIGAYLMPTKLMEDVESESLTELQYAGNGSPIVWDKTITKNTALNSYTPKNNKLLCYPYQYILLSNNAGSSNVLQYELFSGDECTFEIEGVPTIGGSIKCVPKNYKGLERIQEEGIMCGKFPTLSWSEDLYTNWLTQNALNIGIGLGTSALGVVAGVGMMAIPGLNATAGVASIAGGVMGITNTLAQIHQQSFTPDSAKGNVNGGDINTAYKMNTFYFYKMSIKQEYAKIIDQYFSMYGYKVSSLKVPNSNHRKYYWFTKTIEANITGNVPEKDRQKITNCYNKGITFWKSDATFRGYAEDNDIIKRS